MDWIGDNACYNYSAAFRQLGVAPASYYRAIRVPFVQGRIAERMDALDKATAKLLEVHWPSILANMARIAQAEGREAVQAARFLAEQKKKLEEELPTQEQTGPSEARLILEKHKQMRQALIARRRTVEEEVELAS